MKKWDPNYQTIPEKVLAIQVHIGGPRDNLKKIRELGFRIRLDMRKDCDRVYAKPRILVWGGRLHAFTGDWLVRKKDGCIFVHSDKVFRKYIILIRK